MMVLLLILGVLSEEAVNVLRGLWQVIPVLNDLDPKTKFEPQYIDDTQHERGATMDLFVFQPGQQIAWARSIRGLNLGHLISIPNSQFSEYKIFYFNSDAYPDLITLSPNRKSIFLYSNKVRENMEKQKRQQINQEGTEQTYYENWPVQVLYTVGRHIEIADFTILDLNHDGIPDLLISVNSNSQFTIVQLLVTNTDQLMYQVSEISFENSGIIQILGKQDLTGQGIGQIIYISSSKQLCYAKFQQEVYTEITIRDEPIHNENKLEKFYFFDLDQDGFLDILILNYKTIQILHRVDQEWNKADLAHHVEDCVLYPISHSRSRDIVFISGNQTTWLAQTQVGDPQQEFLYIWNTKKTQFGYKVFPIEIEQVYQWTLLDITDLDNSHSIDLLLFSGNEKTIYWGRKKKANLQGVGWDPNFWIYLMTYVIAMSLAAGLFHAYKVKNTETQKKLDLPKWKPSTVINEEKGKINIRKITV